MYENLLKKLFLIIFLLSFVNVCGKEDRVKKNYISCS